MTIYNLVFKQQDNGGSLCTATVLSEGKLMYSIFVYLDKNSTIGTVRDELKKKANHMSREDVEIRYNNFSLDDDMQLVSAVEYEPTKRDAGRGRRLVEWSQIGSPGSPSVESGPRGHLSQNYFSPRNRRPDMPPGHGSSWFESPPDDQIINLCGSPFSNSDGSANSTPLRMNPSKGDRYNNIPRGLETRRGSYVRDRPGGSLTPPAVMPAVTTPPKRKPTRKNNTSPLDVIEVGNYTQQPRRRNSSPNPAHMTATIPHDASEVGNYTQPMRNNSSPHPAHMKATSPHNAPEVGNYTQQPRRRKSPPIPVRETAASPHNAPEVGNYTQPRRKNSSPHPAYMTTTSPRDVPQQPRRRNSSPNPAHMTSTIPHDASEVGNYTQPRRKNSSPHPAYMTTTSPRDVPQQPRRRNSSPNPAHMTSTIPHDASEVGNYTQPMRNNSSPHPAHMKATSPHNAPEVGNYTQQPRRRKSPPIPVRETATSPHNVPEVGIYSPPVLSLYEAPTGGGYDNGPNIVSEQSQLNISTDSLSDSRLVHIGRMVDNYGPLVRTSRVLSPPIADDQYTNCSDRVSLPDDSDPGTALVSPSEKNPLGNDSHSTESAEPEVAPKPKSLLWRFLVMFGLPAIIGGVCCCIGLAFLIVGIILVAGDTLSSGECNSSHHSWMFTCAFNDGSGSFPVGWYSKPTLLVNWGESGRLGVFDPPKTLQPNSSCESGIGIGGYYPSVPSDQCVEYCTHWCRVKEQQVLKDGSAATGSICCEATTEPTCTCTAHKHPSVVVVGNTSSYAVEYKFTLSESSDVIEKENRHCSNISMNGIDTEDNCYIQSFRMLSSMLKPFPCHTNEHVPDSGLRDDICYEGLTNDNSNPTVGRPLLLCGFIISGIIIFMFSFRHSGIEITNSESTRFLGE